MCACRRDSRALPLGLSELIREKVELGDLGVYECVGKGASYRVWSKCTGTVAAGGMVVIS